MNKKKQSTKWNETIFAEAGNTDENDTTQHELVSIENIVTPLQVSRFYFHKH